MSGPDGASYSIDLTAHVPADVLAKFKADVEATKSRPRDPESATDTQDAS